MNLHSFHVENLYGFRNVNLPIKDNRLIMVGLNGLGKSTVLNLLYFFLSRQWGKMLEYQFDAVTLRIGRRKLRLTRDEIADSPLPSAGGDATSIPPALRNRIMRLRGTALWNTFIRANQLTEHDLRPLAHELRVTHSAVRRLRNQFFHGREEASASEKLAEYEEFLTQNLGAKILYLPTYRRIEKELELIFPEIVREIRRYSNEASVDLNKSSDHFIELVEFGMEDVRQQVSSAQESIKEDARKSLNNLAATYMRDVIRGEAEKFKPASLAQLLSDVLNGYFKEEYGRYRSLLQLSPNESEEEVRDRFVVKTILDKVEEETLSEGDKQKLLDVIVRLRAGGDKATTQDLYVAHYFSKVTEIIRRIFDKERAISHFVKTCNSYLQNKKIEYDGTRYSIGIYQGDKRQIDWRMLSSGEKQVVSLMSHLYLTGNEKYIVIIDEPELSLSVPWQAKFLPDILASGKCSFIGAVTHSPFIFDNELDRYVIDIRDHIIEDGQA